jgi:hypothetical protein
MSKYVKNWQHYCAESGFRLGPVRFQELAPRPR